MNPACCHFIEHLEKQGTDFSRLILAGYWPIKSEVDPRPLHRSNSITRWTFSLTRRP
ncbi:hypothetical protein [Bartonella massiliensis]|uniref:hypothetical protein n=1 Tax=Bartonella massiliensis TaxID=929795 RepID=UPI003CCC7AEB